MVIMKVVINKCFGGFGLSESAQKRFEELTGKRPSAFIERDDPAVVQVVEEMGVSANGVCASLKIITLPDGVDWEIQDYDGFETLTQPLIDLEEKYAHLQPTKG